MSYTTIKAVYYKDRIEDIRTLSNSWLSAPIVWNYLCEKYLTPNCWIFPDKSQPLWDLWNKPEIPVHQRAVLLMTFDRFIIKKSDYKIAALDIRLFLEDLQTNAGYWPEIAELFYSGPDYPAIGFRWTSCAGNPFLDDEDKIRWDDIRDVYDELLKTRQ